MRAQPLLIPQTNRKTINRFAVYGITKIDNTAYKIGTNVFALFILLLLSFSLLSMEKPEVDNLPDQNKSPLAHHLTMLIKNPQNQEIRQSVIQLINVENNVYGSTLKSLIMLLAKTNDIELLEQFVAKHPCHLDVPGRIQLFENLVKHSLIEPARYLITKCHVDFFQDYNPFRAIALYGSVEFLDLLAGSILNEQLIDKLLDVLPENSPSRLPPLEIAIKNDRFNFVKRLIETYNLDPCKLNKKGYCALHIAAGMGKLAILKYLVERTKNAAIKTNLDKSLMHFAAQQSDTKILDYLIGECHLSPDAADKNQALPIHDAAQTDTLESFLYLLDKTSDALLKTTLQRKWTIGHCAAAAPSTKVLNYLLTNKLIDKSVIDANLHTLLHVAAAEGRIDSVKLLVELYNIPAHIQNTNGVTPLHLAQERKQKSVVDYLSKLPVVPLETIKMTPIKPIPDTPSPPAPTEATPLLLTPNSTMSNQEPLPKESESCCAII